MDNEQRDYQIEEIDLSERLQCYIDAANCDNQRRRRVPQEDDNPGARIRERGYEGEYPEL